jgi:hypothetical protein
MERLPKELWVYLTSFIDFSSVSRLYQAFRDKCIIEEKYASLKTAYQSLNKAEFEYDYNGFFSYPFRPNDKGDDMYENHYECPHQGKEFVHTYGWKMGDMTGYVELEVCELCLTRGLYKYWSLRKHLPWGRTAGWDMHNMISDFYRTDVDAQLYWMLDKRFLYLATYLLPLYKSDEADYEELKRILSGVQYI